MGERALALPPVRWPEYSIAGDILLRPFTLADAPRVQLLAGDWDVAAPTGLIPHPYADGLAEAWIEQMWTQRSAGTEYSFAIVRAKDGLLVGALGLRPAGREREHAGYWIGRPYWGHGYATAALREGIGMLFEYGIADLLTSTHLASNTASGRVMEKCGLSIVGTLRRRHRGVERDFVIRGITREEWAHVRAPIRHVPIDLRTDRVAFELLTEAHAAKLLAGMADPTLNQWIDRPPPDLATLTKRFAAIAKPYDPAGGLALNWALRNSATGEYLGVAEAAVQPDRTATIAYFIFSPHQRRGYAMEAAAAVIAHLQEYYAVHHVAIRMDTCNIASQRVAEKLGFVRDGQARTTGDRHGAPAFDYRYKLEFRAAPD